MSWMAGRVVWVAASWSARVSVKKGDEMVAVMSTGSVRVTVGRGMFNKTSAGEGAMKTGVVDLIVGVVDMM